MLIVLNQECMKPHKFSCWMSANIDAHQFVHSDWFCSLCHLVFSGRESLCLWSWYEQVRCHQQTVLKCLCGLVLSSAFTLAEDLAGGLCAFHLCYKEIISQLSNNVKVLTGTPKIILAIPLAIWCGQRNRMVQMKPNSVVFYITFKNSEELS